MPSVLTQRSISAQFWDTSSKSMEWALSKLFSFLILSGPGDSWGLRSETQSYEALVGFNFSTASWTMNRATGSVSLGIKEMHWRLLLSTFQWIWCYCNILTVWTRTGTWTSRYPQRLIGPVEIRHWTKQSSSWSLPLSSAQSEQASYRERNYDSSPPSLCGRTNAEIQKSYF